jgi:hypothetical protein
MKTRGKVCWAGAGLLVVGTGLAATGAVLLASVGFSWAVEQIRKTSAKSADRTFAKLESASASLGSVAGRMQHHFTRAADIARKAGQGAAKGVNEALARD